MKIFLTILLIVSSTVFANAQLSNLKVQSCEERAQQIVRTLEKSNFLRTAVEQGSRGDCIRFNWMDKMQKFGIKQASYLVESKWKNNEASFKIKGIYYIKTYYQNYDTALIKEKNLLEEIREGGLEKELKEIILSKLEKSAFAKREKGSINN